MDLFSIELVIMHSGIAFPFEDTYDTALELAKKTRRLGKQHTVIDTYTMMALKYCLCSELNRFCSTIKCLFVIYSTLSERHSIITYTTRFAHPLHEFGVRTCDLIKLTSTNLTR